MFDFLWQSMADKMTKLGCGLFNLDVPDIVLRSFFMKYDKQGKNYLDNKELQELFQYDLGLTKEQAETYTYLLDKNGDAKICYDEFCAWLKSDERFKNVNDKSRYHFVRKAVELFKKYDKDKSGALERKEFAKLVKESGGKKSIVNKALKELDLDNNGVISFQEFLWWLGWVPMDSW